MWWGHAVRIYGNQRCLFSWAHDGEEVNGWVEFQTKGKLFTRWGPGTWEPEPLGEGPLHLTAADWPGRAMRFTFCTKQHVCRIMNDGCQFEVVAKYEKVHPYKKHANPCKTRGWPRWLDATSPPSLPDLSSPHWLHGSFPPGYYADRVRVASTRPTLWAL